MSTISGLSSVDDILDSDLVMITHANGQSYKMAGIEINKRNQAVIASNTTLTGAPLKTGNVVRAYFTADLVAANSSTALSLSYNSVSYPVKVPKDGALVNYTPFEVDTNTYKYLQAYTTLELLYDGTNFIVLNNPVVISGSGFNIHADGSGKVNEVAANNMQSVTSNAVYNAINKMHYYHTTFTGSSENGWQTVQISFDKTFKYPPLVSVTCRSNIIVHPTEYYWRETASPFYVATTTGIVIAYYVRDNYIYTFDVNAYGELP